MKDDLKKDFYKKWWFWLIIVIVLVSFINSNGKFQNNTGGTVTDPNTGINTTQTSQASWHEIQTFKGKGNQNTSSFQITGNSVRIKAVTSGGHVGTYSAFDLEKETGGYLGAGLSISTDGAENGTGETIYRNIKAGSYYLSVITGVSWNVIVEEYR